MELPVYVTVEEVQRVCKALNLRDWTQLTDAKVLPEEAGVILQGGQYRGHAHPPGGFRHRPGGGTGTRHPLSRMPTSPTIIPILTGKIVLAHLKETMDYYQRLDVAELEGDLLKAMAAKDLNKAGHKYRKLLKAKLALAEAEFREIP